MGFGIFTTLNVLQRKKKFKYLEKYKTLSESQKASQVVLVVKNPPANVRDRQYGFNPWVKKIPWRRHDNPLQYSWLEYPMDRGAWQATVHRVTKNWTQLKRLSTHAHWEPTLIPKNLGFWCYPPQSTKWKLMGICPHQGKLGLGLLHNIASDQGFYFTLNKISGYTGFSMYTTCRVKIGRIG